MVAETLGYRHKAQGTFHGEAVPEWTVPGGNGWLFKPPAFTKCEHASKMLRDEMVKRGHDYTLFTCGFSLAFVIDDDCKAEAPTEELAVVRAWLLRCKGEMENKLEDNNE